MGKLNYFMIYLNNATGIYYGGQTVDGTVSLELNDSMKMREIRLGIHGGARVHWTEQHSSGSGKNRRTRTVHYTSEETYLNHKVMLFGKGPGQSDDPVLPPGRYNYPFQFQIPPECPSSFEGAWGRVRYELKATIDKPWKFDHHTKTAFTVLDVLDLNNVPGVMNGAEGQDQKTLCCLCCKSGPISAKLRLERLGYVPGEAIPILGEVINMSNRKMKLSKIVLKQVVEFHARGKTRRDWRSITELVKGEITPGGTEQWMGERLIIPPVPSSFLTGCRIMDVNYMVQLHVDPAGPAFDLVVPLTVTIGTIPLRAALQAYGLPPDMPPPSYAAAVSGNVNIRDESDSNYTMGNLDYTPQYTYYNWNQQ